MLVKSYENKELRRELAGQDSEREAEKLEDWLLRRIIIIGLIGRKKV